MKKAIFWSAVMASALTVVQAVTPAQAAAPEANMSLSKLWKIDAGTSVTPGALPWFNSESSDNMTRGLAFNAQTGHLLVADRDTTDTGGIYVLDASNGSVLGSFNLTGVTGGIFFLNKIAVDDSGRVFVCNLATAAGTTANYQNDFRVYMYASEAAALSAGPSTVYAADATKVRWGDDLAAKGSGVSTKLVVGSRSTTGVLVLSDPENDGSFAPSVLSPAGVNGPGNVAFDNSASMFWYHPSAYNYVTDWPALQFNLDGSATGTSFPLTIGYSTGAIDVSQWRSVAGAPKPILAVGPADVAPGMVDVRGYVYDLSKSDKPAQQTGGLEKAGGYAANGNGTGDVVLDVANHRVFFLETNNSISAWYMPDGYSAAQDWQLLQ